MRGQFIAAGIALAAAIAVPLVAPGAEYALSILFLVFLYGAMSSAWNLLGGFAGQVSFGHAAFLGIGAYVTGLLWNAGWSPFATIPVAALAAAIFSLIVGPPVFRLRGPYFSIATIGIGEATRLIALNWNGVTGGASGLTLQDAPSTIVQYLSALGLCAVAMGLSAWIRASRFGYALEAVRQDPDAAETLGVNATVAKTQALFLSAFLVGAAGSVYAMHYLYLSPDSVFGFTTAISLVIMPIIGGVGTIWGPLFGATIFTFIREQLVAKFPNLDLLAFGLLLIAIVLFEPKGLVGMFNRLKARLAKRAPAPAGAAGNDG